MVKIPEGCILVARKILKSDIWQQKPSWWLKVWEYILLRVNHKDNKQFKRGQNFFKRGQIHYDCKLHLEGIEPDTVDNVIRWLRKTRQISTKKAMRGIIITVCNYESYQNLKNYKNDLSSQAEKVNFQTTQKTTQNSDDKEGIRNDTENDAENEIETTQKRHYKQECKECKEINIAHFEQIWLKYPNKVSKGKAQEKFIASVKTEKDFSLINKALDTYKKHLALNTWKKTQDGKTWFNDKEWRSWIDFQEQQEQKGKGWL